MVHDDMREILERAGVRHSEAAQIFRVSPATVKRWLFGETTPKQVVVFEMACKFVSLIDDAVKLGHLPVKDAVGKQRMVEIKAAIRLAAVGRV